MTRNARVPRPFGYEPMKPATIPAPRISPEQIAAVRERVATQPDADPLAEVLGLDTMEATA